MKKIRVLVVDDSEYNREAMTRMLESSPRISVIGAAADGEEAIERVVRQKPDFITLDLEMPRMDGFTFLRWLMRSMPLPVVVVSSKADDKSVIRALEFGAVDFLPKPIGPESSMDDLRAELVRKVVAFADTEMTKVRTSVALIEEATRQGPEKGRAGRAAAKPEYDVLAIGASTGGPPAIQAIVTVLPKNFPLPVIVSQHMPPKFTRFFAERLDKLSKLRVKEAAEGDLVTPGRVFVAPGGVHMALGRARGGVKVELKEPGGRDKYVPSVDVMMRSAAMNYGGRVLGVILTGMGNDGKEGMQMIKGMGGRTLAESKETAVIFGMPKEAVMAGAVDKVVPLGRMAAEILELSGMKG